MGWTETWDDILSGGFQRWKVLDAKAHEEAIFHLKRAIGDKTGASILCPLAGDDPVVNKLFKEGYAVTAIDLVPSALEAMRSQFEGEWSKLEAGDTVVWKHESGRATQYEGDMLKSRPELRGKFDAVYDKDSFGALSPELRSSYISRLAEYTLPGSALYVETKLKENHEQVKNEGPPFSFLPEEVQDQFSKFFSYSEYMGEIYQLALPNMKQTAHMLRRL